MLEVSLVWVWAFLLMYATLYAQTKDGRRLPTCIQPAPAHPWRTRQRLCVNRVRSLLSRRCMLLGYSFKPRPNSRALVTAGFEYEHQFINRRVLALKNPVWREKTDLLVRKFRLRWRQRLDTIQAEPPFLPLDQEEEKRSRSARRVALA